MGAFDLLAELTARLAATARLDEIVGAVMEDIAQMGFGGVWIAVLDEQTGLLSTLKQMINGVDTTAEMPKIDSLDMRQPIGRGFHERRMINVVDPSTVILLEGDNVPVPPGKLGLPRQVYDQLRGRPFAVGPLLGSRNQPVGALGLSYRNHKPVPDEMLSQGILRVFMHHLGIAIERARHVEQLDANLAAARATLAHDARLKAIGELAVVVAHDLNHLSAIALLAAGVGMRSPADALDVLPRIERVNRAMADLVARLQRIARPKAGEAEVANLQQTVDDILIMVKPLMRERAIEVDAELPAAPPVRCDAGLLHQVILNLLVNAHDALADVSADHRRIAIRIVHDHAAVRLSVADSGPGIAPGVLAHLFEPFKTTKGDSHLGLGLAAAHAALARFGATLTGRNAPAGGAVFEVTLAVAQGGAPDRAAPAPVADLPARAERIAILAVDDDPDVVYFIREYLDPRRYDVATATSAAQAIEAAQARRFDVVLCDLGLPKQSGLDVCNLLRSAGYRGKLVLMTGWDTVGGGRAAQCDTVLKKPFVGTELIQLIESLLAPDQPAGPAGAPGSGQ